MRFKLAGVRGCAIGALSVAMIFSAQLVTAQAPTPTPTLTPTPSTTPKPTSSPSPSPSPTLAPTPIPTPTPRPVYPAGFKVTNVSDPNDPNNQNVQIALYNTITVEVDKLDEFLKQAGTDPAKFVLYLNWRPLRGLNARLVDGQNKLMFDIERTENENTQKEWDALLGRPFYGVKKGFTYRVPVSIGYENDLPIPTVVQKDLVVVNKIGFWIFLVIFALSLYVFWWLATNKGIIRDPCPDLPENKRPYSLGRTQMAFWFFVVASSYVLIWMITSNRDALTAESLALLGISTATALGAAVVGSSNRNAAQTKQKNLELERDTLKERLAQFVEEKKTSTADKLTELNREEAEKTARLAQVEKELVVPVAQRAPQESQGFLSDILSDDEGISLHRFQMAIWTIVLGVIFVAAVYNSLAMPKFSGTLLALMGISGGTYIGFKFPEKPS